MNITLIHPSRERPELAYEAAMRWELAASNPAEVEYLISLDETDPRLDDYKERFESSLRVIGDNKSAIEAINAAAKKATGNLFVVMSDDFDCPNGWDKSLLDALEGKEDFLVKTQDLCQPWIITLPVLDRKYYNRFGYIYNPAYSHMFSDTEMTHVGHLLGRVITLPVVFQHRHYTQRGGQPKDAVNQKNDSTWTQGEDVYLAGLKNNFGIENPEPLILPFHHIGWLQTKGILP